MIEGNSQQHDEEEKGIKPSPTIEEKREGMKMSDNEKAELYEADEWDSRGEA